ncbi:P1 family peptidase [Lysobacter niastensis]|uniref:P1 family peptidase n=1 Tax=Lysobacter niastensis TaxID=380629 RepID=A0ABS0B8M5_9GAMM|nr:P1 family peptidase [Lysobacter niastensis]MBF6024082.1 P1 family peptidase [Lysobacter niastensis]
MTLAASSIFAATAAEPRARDLGVPFEGSPGTLNAITDVAGVSVGQVTLVEDLADGNKVRTGVTAILPRGRGSFDTPVFGGWFALNGNGEMTGTAWLEESGQLEGPVMLTNTHSVGVVRDAVIAERVRAGGADASGYWWSLPVVAETWDGHLNDINGFHVKPEHAAQALSDAKDGPVAEGNVGGGTGMVCHEFKCGIGTASRRVAAEGQGYTVGALVQANYGVRDTLRIAGVPVGQHLREDRVYTDLALAVAGEQPGGDTGSIIVVIATDAPLLPHQLKRLAKRAGMGLARMGSYAGNGSGDIFIAFSTANAAAAAGAAVNQAQFVGNDHLDTLFEATVQATEEAIVNAMVAARDMRGEDGHYAKALPHAELVKLLKRYGRYERSR